MTHEDFVVCCIAPLETAYGRMDPLAVRMYFTMLKDYDVSTLSAAVLSLIADLRWLPKVAEIRQACGNIALGQIVEMHATEAWGLARKAIANIDLDRPATLAAAKEKLPETVWEAMRNAGLAYLVSGKDEWTSKAFMDAYNAVMTRERKLRLAPPQVLAEIESRRQSLRLPASAAAKEVAAKIGYDPLPTRGNDR
jgi:hypothetical protein